LENNIYEVNFQGVYYKALVLKNKGFGRYDIKWMADKSTSECSIVDFKNNNGSEASVKEEAAYIEAAYLKREKEEKEVDNEALVMKRVKREKNVKVKKEEDVDTDDEAPLPPLPPRNYSKHSVIIDSYDQPNDLSKYIAVTVPAVKMVKDNTRYTQHFYENTGSTRTIYLIKVIVKYIFEKKLTARLKNMTNRFVGELRLDMRKIDPRTKLVNGMDGTQKYVAGECKGSRKQACYRCLIIVNKSSTGTTSSGRQSFTRFTILFLE